MAGTADAAGLLLRTLALDFHRSCGDAAEASCALGRTWRSVCLCSSFDGSSVARKKLKRLDV